MPIFLQDNRNALLSIKRRILMFLTALYVFNFTMFTTEFFSMKYCLLDLFVYSKN